MPDYLIWPVLIIVAYGSFLFGARIENACWRQRCNDMLTTIEAMKKSDSK